MDRDDGRWVYEVEFYYGSKEYDYDIDALTGDIRSRDYDVENFTIPTSSGSDIGAEEGPRASPSPTRASPPARSPSSRWSGTGTTAA